MGPAPIGFANTARRLAFRSGLFALSLNTLADPFVNFHKLRSGQITRASRADRRE